MPHSPYIQQVEAQVSEQDFAAFRYDFQRIRWERDEGIDDIFAQDTTLHNGELLIEQCEFLEAKVTIKKRENFQLITQSEALADKVATLETECRVMRDENRVCKEELAAVKAKLAMETEQLQKENQAYEGEVAALKAKLDLDPGRVQKVNKAYQEKLVAGLFAKLEQENLESADTDKAAAEAAQAADGGNGRYHSVARHNPDPLEPPPLKRKTVSDRTFDPKPPRKVRRIVASVEGKGEEDAVYIG